jgi:hypothetical protein
VGGHGRSPSETSIARCEPSIRSAGGGFHGRELVRGPRDLAEAGVELWDTGMAPPPDVVHEDRVELVARMLGTVHRVVPNPHFEPGK